MLVGKRLTDDVIAEAGTKVAARASRWTTPTSTSTGAKRSSGDFVGYALRELRGDDMRATRLRIARHAV